MVRVLFPHIAASLVFLLVMEISAEDQPRKTNTVDPTTLRGKVMCGYQGWFNCEGDGAGLGWKHWARRANQPFAPGNVTVDLWPDLSEFTADERYKTGFKHADGKTAEVFSSSNRRTVLRHFEWMRTYEIDGVFLQRFAVELSSQKHRQHMNAVLSHVREGAKQSGRAFAMMYDLSGLRAGEVNRVQEDWANLHAKMKITSDPAYLKHKGHPLVAVWGIGFNDGRKYSLAECLKLVKWLKSEGCTVMLGVPSYWRQGNRDAVNDPLLYEIIKMSDVISPWSVGRYQTPKQATGHAAEIWAADRDWCDRFSLDFLPVVFPGFSWHNLKGDPLNAIPRLKGRFLWSQIVGVKQAGCEMIYVAMFDEVDEATAIFKCTNNPPVGERVKFLDYEGLPSDFYLKLTGHAGKVLRGETPLTDELPNLNSPVTKPILSDMPNQ